MASFTRGITFATNGTITAENLHNLIDQTTPRAGIITDRSVLTTMSTGDRVLIADTDDATNAYFITTGSLVGQALSGATYGGASFTAGTIATFNSTTGTVTNLNSTSGTVATLNSTTGTIATGTITTLNSTTGTINTLNSTTGTITNLSTTLAGDFTISQGTGTIGTSTTNRLVPIGSIVAFAVNTAPTGWLAADGSGVSRTTYASLFSTIGTTHGSGDGSTTFNLPDLRGIFVRGSGSQTISGDTYSGMFATRQQDDFKSHTHPIDDTTAAYGSNTNVFSATQSRLTSQTSRTSGSTGGTETRPANIALLYCIKF